LWALQLRSEQADCGSFHQVLDFFVGWLSDASTKGGFDFLSKGRIEIERVEPGRHGFPKLVSAPKILGAILLDAPKIGHNSLTRPPAPALSFDECSDKKNATRFLPTMAVSAAPSRPLFPANEHWELLIALGSSLLCPE
jgi:hypothetical protein